jgi:hypothetical protein
MLPKYRIVLCYSYLRMPLIANTTSEELYGLLKDMNVDTTKLKRTKPSYDYLAKIYLELLDVELIRFRYERMVIPMKNR